MAKNRSQKIYTILYIALIVTYLVARIDHINAIEKYKIYPDTTRYLAIASSPLNSKAFWASYTPVVVPIIYRLLQGDYNGIAWFQSIFSIFSWMTLAWVVSRQMDKAYLQLIAFGLLLAFSLNFSIILWDWSILSESVSGSLMALLIASWVWLCSASDIRGRHILAVTALGVLWVFTRDSNALIILMGSVFPVFFVIFTKSPKKLLIVSTIYLVAYLISGQLADIGGRWVGPNLNVISRRILKDKTAFQFYLDQGMPDGDKLPAYEGTHAGPVDMGFDDGEDNELEAFHKWHRDNGKSVYISYVLSTPIPTFGAPFYKAFDLMNAYSVLWYFPKGFAPILPPIIENIIFFPEWSDAIEVLSIAIFLLGGIIAIGKPDPRWITLIILCLLLYPHAFLIWHASGGDVARHAYQLRVHYRLTLLLFSLFSVNTLLNPQTLRTIIQRWHWIITRYKILILVAGPLLILASFVFDLISQDPSATSIGSRQIAGILVGVFMIAAGILVSFFPAEDSSPESAP